MTKKITKEVLYTELKVLQAKLDKVLDLLQENKPTLTESKPIFGTTGCLVCGRYDCPASYTNLPCSKMSPYALRSGSIQSACSEPTWNIATDRQDVEE